MLVTHITMTEHVTCVTENSLIARTLLNGNSKLTFDYREGKKQKKKRATQVG